MHALLSRWLTRALLSLAFASWPVAAQYPNTNSPLGINPSESSDWSTEVAYIDMFQWFRGWENHSDPNGTMPREQLDENGWPLYVNSGQEVTVGHGAGTGGHYPGGRYLFTWEGEGTFSPRMGCTFVSTDLANKRIVINVDSTREWWGIRLETTNPSNHARNMHCWLPGFWDEATFQLKPQYRGEIFHPEYIKTLERFSPLRFMGYLGTNGSSVRTWSDFKPGNWWNQGTSDHANFGHVSPLRCIQLANRVHADAWINIPHAADDNLVRTFARLVRDSLAPDLKVYVEYSNECWNWAYPFNIQAQYCTDQAKVVGLPGNGPAEYFAYRSAQIWRMFDEEFGGQKSRVIKVLAWQVGTDFSWHFDILGNTRWNPDRQWPDICAIAPYIHNNGVPLGIATGAFIDSTINRLIPELRADVRRSAAAARANNCRIGAYEANQHFFSDATAAQNYYLSVKHDPRMKDLQLAYLAMIDAEMDGPLAMFLSHGTGTWGAREWYNQPRSEAPIWDAWLTYIEGIAGPVGVAPAAPRAAPYAIVQSPARATCAFSLLGRLLLAAPGPGAHAEARAQWNAAAPGVYVLPLRPAAGTTVVAR